MTRQAILIGFALWVTDADQPPYKRASFPDYAACVDAGRAQVDSQRQWSPAVTWRCLSND
jgi:hypothetical protein